MKEKIIETKVCKKCNATFEITDNDIEFYSKISPKYNWEKFNIPTPTLCPECRSQRRLSYRNDRSLYKTTCAFTGKWIISMHNPENNFIIAEHSEWWKDNWNGLDYGTDFDYSKWFFEQFNELKKVVPRFNLFNVDTENCEYVNYAPHSKNCYLLFGSWLNEDCYYGQTLNECNNSIDNLFLNKSELCYENIDCNDNYKSVWCQNCNNVNDSYFCFDCTNVKNCIWCYNLQNKEYHILNKPVSKEEFEKEKAKMSCYENFKTKKDLYQKHIKENAIFKDFTWTNNENVTWDFIFNSKNAKNCFSLYDSENIAYSARLIQWKNIYDFDWWWKWELLLENMSNDFSYNSIWCTTCESLKNSHYCDLCFNCENIFWCVWLKWKKYCIFNKQYTKEEYELLVWKIIKHMQINKEWWEFSPVKYSPFSYNETMANEYFPLNKQETIEKWFSWSDYEQPIPKVEKIIPADKLPNNISDIPDDILNWAIKCENTKKPFRIIKQELEFYRKQGLPIPRKNPDERHLERMKLRNPRKLFNRKCNKCENNIKTSYSPNREETVYCEKCYNNEFY